MLRERFSCMLEQITSKFDNKKGFMNSWPERVNPSNAEATFVQSTRMQRFLKTISTLLCWHHWIALAEYSLMSTHVSGFQSFSIFMHHFVLAILATTSIRVNLFEIKPPLVYMVVGGIFRCKKKNYSIKLLSMDVVNVIAINNFRLFSIYFCYNENIYICVPPAHA